MTQLIDHGMGEEGGLVFAVGTVASGVYFGDKQQEFCPQHAVLLLLRFIGSVFSFRVLSIDHQPSSVLRSPPMAALGSDYLSNLPVPDYHPSYQVPSELQGNNQDLWQHLPNTHNCTSLPD